MSNIPILVLGLLALWAGSLVTVRGAVRFADARGLSKGFVGLAILAIGTDVPEFVVAVSASIQQLQGQDTSAIVFGSAVGSAIAAEIGTMAVSEELSALEVLSIDVLGYLVVPRLVGLAILCPLLTILCDAVGIVGKLFFGFRRGAW